ncbi:MAG: hypothetical protein LBL86_06885 [Coriobacteriales bacterium]|jgi:hypothetical protein|nr:hypothetical protein [Coriobacteriales bacterium]
MELGEAKGSGPVRKAFRLRSAIILSVAGLLFALAVAVAIPFGIRMLLVGEAYETRDVAEYGIYEGHIEAEGALPNQFSKLLVFPKELPDDAVVDDFYYWCSNGGLENSYQLLLDYRLSPEAFKAEVERLQGIKVSLRGRTKHVVYDTESFEYPAYVTVFENSGDCEFALIDEKNSRIVAVLATGGRGSLDASLFPQSTPKYGDSIVWLGFSVYQFESGDNAAVMAG